MYKDAIYMIRYAQGNFTYDFKVICIRSGCCSYCVL